MRDRFIEVVRGLVLLGCALILFLSAAAVTQSSGVGGWMATIRDDVLSLITDIADGDPTHTHVNASGALWTVDSDLADTFNGGSVDVSDDGESNVYGVVLPVGTRSVQARLMPYGANAASATDFVYVRIGDSGAYRMLTLTDPFEVADMDMGTNGATLSGDSGGGKVKMGVFYTVSQNPD